MSMEVLFETLIIEALEGRDTDFFDVPGAYLHVEIPKDKIVLLIVWGDFVDIMCEVNPEHKNNFIYENEKRFCTCMWLELYMNV